MVKTQRPCLIVGNWKMYKTIEQATAFIDSILPTLDKGNCQVMLAVPYTCIRPLAEKVKGTSILIGAQNMNDAMEGAFTGEVAAIMLKEAGAEFVLLGHSERRTIFHENNAFIHRKVQRALACNLKPILCIGETFDERQQNQTEEVLQRQLSECLEGVSKEAANILTLAYEPVWAIGTGLAATPEIAASALNSCRNVLSKMWGESEAAKVPILYGGSVNPKNAQSYLALSENDGLLIGSASLDADSFAKIIALRQNAAIATKS